MTMKMTLSEFIGLEPCPFCGGEARHYAPGPVEHHIECVYCYADIKRDSEIEAIKAWNARAELTCKPKWTLQGTTQTQEFWRCDCGNCDECFGVEDRRGYVTLDKVEIPNYCPSCGVRIEVER